MKKLIILLLTLTLILGVFASCNKRYIQIDEETSSSPSEDISTVSDETSRGIADDTAETTSEVNESTSPTTTDISGETFDITSDTQGMADIPPADIEYPSEYNYRVEKRGDQYYMVFDSDDVSKPENITIYPGGGFRVSLDELKNKIPNGILSDTIKYAILSDYVDTDTERAEGLKMYDIERIWRPSMVPSGWILQNYVDWHISSYRFPITWGDTETEESSTGYITILLKDTYYNTYADIDMQSAEVLQSGDIVYTVVARPSDSFWGYKIWCSNGEFYSLIEIIGYKELSNEEILSFGFVEC